MSFRISARTIFHLGSELISSDGVAFYELIKNSIDAGSRTVSIRIVSRIQFTDYDSILRELGARYDPFERISINPSKAPDSWLHLREKALRSLTKNAPNLDPLIKSLNSANTYRDFITALKEANYIEIADDGEGMSIDVLQNEYLTIGTSHRARQRQAQSVRYRSDHSTSKSAPNVILGEKGLGRLSAMRLGDSIEVVTADQESTHWNLLSINWTDFATAADDDLTTVPLNPYVGQPKSKTLSGTCLHITALKSPWSYEKVVDLTQDTFAKLVDPFSTKRLPIDIEYNGVSLKVPEFASFILAQSHGVFTATYDPLSPPEPTLFGEMDYRLSNRRKTFKLMGPEVSDMTGNPSRDTLLRIGPFRLEVYWFNRRILTKIEGIGDLAQVRRLIASWAGGVSLYRDGYRVNPYGGPNDDWLRL